ncbi:hypothetical protein EYF80_051589 [Liparis tanakae]|uniref:Uncharacterized protein n=1 Tax=Liparis tanakae TaxID=230148 RepID=A0A4Z2FAM1_9TELE|nr:hypothetical protein EYF80_051589 [Liparis tanakae]
MSRSFRVRAKHKLHPTPRNANTEDEMPRDADPFGVALQVQRTGPQSRQHDNLVIREKKERSETSH